MSPSEDKTQTRQGSGDSGEGLQEVLLRLTGAPYSLLQDEIGSLQAHIDSLEGSLRNVEGQLSQQSALEESRRVEIQKLLGEARAESAKLSASLSALDESLHTEISDQMERLQASLGAIEKRLDDPEQIARRLSPVLIPVTEAQVREDEVGYASAVAPVIGPAIRHQIRSARQDIIDALYPIIGQIIAKAISEEIRELSRQIDTRLRRQLDFRSRVDLFVGRLRGVPEAELILRGAVPYRVHHVFLVHQQTGLLLSHLPASGRAAEDPDLISGMLKAIQDFVRDSFGVESGELEEITYGDQRILLEGGQYAYAAVVLEGVEPPGYAGLMRSEVSDINLHHEADLRAFSGDMSQLPDFHERLAVFAAPSAAQLKIEAGDKPVGRAQQLALIGALVGIVLFLGLLIFGCVFTVRLWPLVFP